MGKNPLLLLGLLAAGYLSDAYKILVVFPLPGRSHSILGEGVVRHLLNAGHEVTYITPFLMNSNNSNLHQIDLSDHSCLIPHRDIMESIMKKQIQLSDHRFVMEITRIPYIKTLEHPTVQKLLNDTNQTFDAVIVEWMFGELLAGLSAVYNAPLIWLSPVEPHWLILELIDDIPNPAYITDMWSENTPPLNFKERVEELWTVIRVLYIKLTYADKHEEELYNKFLMPEILKRRSSIPPFQEVKYSGSLVLGNTHVSVGQPIRLPQNYKHVGGYHIEGNIEPLPKGLKKIMDEAMNGVIYFSMGSNLNSKDMPEEMKMNVLKMFGTLKQTIIWKFEEELPGRPKNVHLVKWAPQPSILAHPNCVLFITHGGLLSTTETVHFGVPIIGIPIFADQFTNVIQAVRRGIALKVDFSNTVADDLKIAIEEILGNPKYTQTVKQLSTIFHDRQMTPGAELVYWVAYVIRTKGAPHLKSPALLLPWYQKAYLDLAIIILIIFIVAILFIRKLLYFLFAKKKVDGIKKKN